MPIDGITLTEGATYTPAGGTSIVFDRTGELIANGVVCGNMSETDFFAREKLYAVARMPTAQADDEFSKQKTSLRIVRPKVLASGKTVYNLMRVEIETHPEGGLAEIANFRKLGISCLNSTSLDSFFQAGSLK